MNFQKEKMEVLEIAIESLHTKVSSINKKIKKYAQPDDNNFKKIRLNTKINEKSAEGVKTLGRDDLLKTISKLENKNKKMTTYISLLILFFILLVIISFDLNNFNQIS